MSAPEGIVLVDKPKGITSHDAVDAVRRALGTRKVGHAGTLDPMATGLLVMGVGRATRLLRFLSALDKEYEGTGRLGVETDTLDAEGEVVRESPVDVGERVVREAMASLTGEIDQRPPAYSAVRVAGERLYRAARRGEAVEAPPRRVRVEAFELVRYEAPELDFRVVCSSGTYVRSLVADLGARLGCGAHLTRLVRTRIGPYRIAEAALPEGVEAALPIERAVAHLPRVELEEEEARAARHGRALGPSGHDGPHAVFDADRRLIGVWKDEGPRARPLVVLAG
ncbi:MAG TPA: tRNA pseudouridine(55) synthase TruB [Actinomycetota bacterium]